MKAARFMLLMAVSVITAFTFKTSALEYHETTTKVTHFNYSNYTFSYYENGVKKTAHLTDEAFTPDHQMALLREVYSNPEIPGIHYAYDYNGTQNRRLDYNYYAHLGQNDAGYWLGDKKDFYPNPNEDGMTMLLVQIKSTWNPNDHKSCNGREYFEKAVKSIKLMPNFVRVSNSENPGYMFSVDVTASRFFFISKGKPRSTYIKPFYRMFEQISPVNDFSSENNIDSFIDEMKAGHHYYCYHDCTNVFSLKTNGLPHWFSISNAGEAYDLNNLTIFVTDRRFEDELASPSAPDKEIDSKFFNEYGNSQNPGEEHFDLMPRVFIYEVALQASVTQSDTDGYFKVSLDWDSNLDNVNTPEHYWVYLTDGKHLTPLTSVESQPTTVTSHEYLVEQLSDPQKFNYIVVSAPIVLDENGEPVVDEAGNPLVTISAKSNIASVVVPGKDPYFSQAVEFRSRYDFDNEVNVYKNTLTISPTTREDFDNIKNNLNDYCVTRIDASGDKVDIAKIKFSQNDKNGYDYKITYNGDSQDEKNLFDEEKPSLSGTLSGYGKAEVKIIDRFTASTAKNSQSPIYKYCLEQSNSNFSNEVEVKVYKTTNLVEGVGVTREDVDDDYEHRLQQAPSTAVTFDAINEPLANVTEYGVYGITSTRGKKNVSKVCKAENTHNDGTYDIFEMGHGKSLDEHVGTVTIGDEGGKITIVDCNVDYVTSLQYVPVIQTAYDVKNAKYNTYGCDVAKVEYPSVDAWINSRDGKQMLMMTRPFDGYEGFYRVYVAEIVINPTLTKEIDEIYRYRVWRVNGDVSYLDEETLLNELESESGQSIDDNGNAVDWASNYTEIQEIYPKNGQITFTDLFLDKAIMTESDVKEVKYIVRMYSTPGLQPNGQPKSIKSTDGHDFFVSQKEVTAKFTTKGVITGIDELVKDYEVANVTYYNLLGVASDKPHAGVNIVTTRYTDGTVKAEKRLFPER